MNIDIKPCKIAMAQLKVEFGNIGRNLENAANFIKEAAKENADIILLPECFDLGWIYDNKETIDAIPGATTEFLCQQAKDNNIFIVAGLVENSEDKLFNSAVMISPSKGIILKHRKINLHWAEEMVYTRGDKVSVIDTPWGKMGVDICTDNFLKTRCIADTMALMGARAILSPCSWAVDENHDNKKNPYGQEWIDYYNPITTENNISIIGVSNIGTIEKGVWKNHPCIGCSIAMKNGELLMHGPYNEEKLMYITI